MQYSKRPCYFGSSAGRFNFSKEHATRKLFHPECESAVLFALNYAKKTMVTSRSEYYLPPTKRFPAQGVVNPGVRPFALVEDRARVA